jgi:uncharacterized protein
MAADQAPSVLHSSKWRPAKTLRLAVSGDVELSVMETRICDTRAFQRLRKLKQLGLAHLVYPSAQHTRFEHALGSLHKARQMVEAVVSNPQSGLSARDIPADDYVLIRLAALLHDIGNLPFGHTLEDEGCVVTERQEDEARLERFMGTGTEIGEILSEGVGEEGRQTLVGILSGEEDQANALGDRAYIADIVKNTVCADLLDYLERDSYHCNLNISVGDRFMRYLFLTKVNGAKRLAIRLWKEKDDRPRPDLLSELTFLLEARYHLAERVYFHHAKSATSAMISRAIWAALQDYGPKKLTVEKLCGMGDVDLLNWLAESGPPQAEQLGRMLQGRRLYKRVDQVGREAVQADKTRDRLEEMNRMFHENPADRTRIEDQIADLCGLRPGDVLIYCPDVGMNLKAANMLVTWRNDVRPLCEIDEPLIRGRVAGIIQSHENLWQCKVFIHPEQRDDREVLRRVRAVASCHLRGNGVYGREIVEQVLHELGEKERILLPASRIRKVAEKALQEASQGPPLSRSLLLKELRDELGRPARD